jgi:hypothetical protein
LLDVHQVDEHPSPSIIEAEIDSVTDFFKRPSGATHSTVEKGAHSDWPFRIIKF